MSDKKKKHQQILKRLLKTNNTPSAVNNEEPGIVDDKPNLFAELADEKKYTTLEELVKDIQQGQRPGILRSPAKTMTSQQKQNRQAAFQEVADDNLERLAKGKRILHSINRPDKVSPAILHKLQQAENVDAQRGIKRRRLDPRDEENAYSYFLQKLADIAIRRLKRGGE